MLSLLNLKRFDTKASISGSYLVACKTPLVKLCCKENDFWSKGFIIDVWQGSKCVYVYCQNYLIKKRSYCELPE